MWPLATFRISPPFWILKWQSTCFAVAIWMRQFIIHSRFGQNFLRSWNTHNKATYFTSYLFGVHGVWRPKYTKLKLKLNWQVYKYVRPSLKELTWILTCALECPMYDFIRDRFPSSFHNVQLGNLKSFFQLDNQVDTNLDLTKALALCCSRELAILSSPS